MPVMIGAAGTNLNLILKLDEQHTGTLEIKELQKNSHTGHRTLTEGSADVEVKVKVNQSRYNPGVAQRVPGS